MPPADHLAILDELIAMGHQIARTIHAQCQAEATRRHDHATAAHKPRPAPRPANDPFPDPTVAFDRIARCVRRCIALHHTLSNPAIRPEPADPRIQARKRILRAVEDQLARKAKPGERDSLREELRLRLDAPDIEDDIAARPVDDIVQDICRDLRIAFPAESWPRRTPVEAERLHREAAAIPPTWSPKPRPMHAPAPARRPGQARLLRDLVDPRRNTS